MSFTKNLKTNPIAKKHRRIASIVVLLSVLFFTHVRAEAAGLSISPASGTVSVGNTITVHVVVDSGGQSINAVSGAVAFSTNTLTLTGISKGGSIITLWAQEPNFSNATGTAGFQGVILNGYTGGYGTLLTLTFRAKAEGTATVTFTSGGSSVLLNDGQGTDVLSGTSNASFTITKASLRSPVPQPTPTPVPVTSPVITPSSTTPAQIFPPVFTDYPSPLSPGNFLVVKGTATASTTVTITVTRTSANGTMTVTEVPVPVSDTGLFAYISDQKAVEGGSYTLVATGFDGQHTPPLSMVVKNSLSFSITNWFANFYALKVSAIITLILLLIALYLFYRNRVLRHRLNMAVDRVQELELTKE